MTRQDIRAAVVSLRRHRGYALVAIVTLGVAIAVNVTMYGMLDAMLEPNTGAVHPERLYHLRYFGDRRHLLPPSAIEEGLRTSIRTVEATTGYQQQKTGISVSSHGHSGEADPILVRPTFFAVLGMRPLAGQLAPTRDGAGVPQIVISDRMRARLFPNGESAVGRAITVDGVTMSVVGVARRSWALSALDTDLWLFAEGTHVADVPLDLARFRDGATVSNVARELSALSDRLAIGADEAPRDNRFYFTPVERQFRVGGFQFVLIDAVLALLLVACANLANLQFARGLTRSRELAIRASIGASRRDLIRMLVTESALIAVAGLALGLLLTWWGMDLLSAVVPSSAAGFVVAPQASWRLFVFAAAVTALCVVLVGFLPALRNSKVDLGALIKGGSWSGAPQSSRRKYGAMILVQVGFTFPVVTAAILLSGSTWSQSQSDYWARRIYGFAPESLLVAHIRYPVPKNSYVRLAPLASQLVSEARQTRDVRDAAMMVTQPPARQAVTVTNADGSTHELPAPAWAYDVVTPSYFQTFARPIIRGRGFAEGEHDRAEVVVDLETAVFLWPGGNPIGQLFKLGSEASNAPWLQVVGVVGDRLDAEGRRRRNSFDTLRLSSVFKVLATDDSVQADRDGVMATLNARVNRDPLQAVGALRRVLADANPLIAPKVEWMQDALGITDRLTRQRFVAGLFALFAGISFSLMTLGVYTIVAQSVGERRQEIAIRVALGATPMSILQLVLREGNVLVLGGIALGLWLTASKIPWLGAFLGDDSLLSAPLLCLMCLSIFCATILAALAPGLRGAHIDPREALKGD